MTDQVKNLFGKEKFGSTMTWVFRAMIFFAIVGIYFLDGIYVRQEEFEQLDQRIHEVERTLLIMAEEARISERQQQLLDDHEQRLRQLEREIYRGSR